MIANSVNEDSHKEKPRKLSQGPTLAIETDVSAGAIDQSLALSQPLDESAVDDRNKLTVKHLDSFDAKRLRIPKRPQKGENNDMLKRLRSDTENDDVSQLST